MRIISSAPLGACALVAVSLVFSPSSSSAQTFGQIGERAQGMAGAFVAVADDASAVYWNPAGLATGSTFDAQLGLTTPKTAAGSDDPQRPLFIGAAMPALGFAYYRERSAVWSSGDRKNGGSGEVRVSPLDTGNFGVSLVQSLVNRAVVGTTLRAVNGAGKSAFDLDVGTMASFGNIRAGAIGRNLRQAMETQRQVRVGVALVPRSLPSGVHGPFTVAFDVDLTRTATVEGDRRQAAVGSEQWWVKGLFGTRVGLHWNTLGATDVTGAGGFTVRLPHSLFAEGHVTKGKRDGNDGWGLGARVTF